MEEDKDKFQPAGMIFAGCMFTGMGIGWVLDHMVPGMFIGMGIGMIAGGIMWKKK